ncbi:MAG: SurA N-terminal domain-containing protein, partial [Nitrolancea sp.]
VTSSGDMSQNVAEVATAMALDGHEYPLVVARVNGEAISSKILAQRVYAVQQAGPGAPKVADPVKTALDALIQEMILRHAARARGIKVSDAEIQAFERQQQQAVAASPDGMSDLRQIAALEGYDSLAAYWAAPRTIAALRNIILLGKMKQQIAQKLAQTLLTPQPNPPENQQQAIDRFVAAQHAHVEIYINE